jgi:hypothetical protein
MDHIRRARNLFKVITIICVAIIIAFSLTDKGFQWMWQDDPQIAVFLLILAIIFGLLWLWYQKQLTTSPYKLR